MKRFAAAFRDRKNLIIYGALLFLLIVPRLAAYPAMGTALVTPDGAVR